MASHVQCIHRYRKKKTGYNCRIGYAVLVKVEEIDVDMYVTPNLMSTVHTPKVTVKANATLGILKKTFMSMDKEIFMGLAIDLSLNGIHHNMEISPSCYIECTNIL